MVEEFSITIGCVDFSNHLGFNLHNSQDKYLIIDCKFGVYSVKIRKLNKWKKRNWSIDFIVGSELTGLTTEYYICYSELQVIDGNMIRSYTGKLDKEKSIRIFSNLKNYFLKL